MNSKALYQALSQLIVENEAFYDQVVEFNGRKFQIFNYRLASYTDFLANGAMEARGVMYDITDTPTIVCRPMEKFFNLGENPLTIGIDLNVDGFAQDKKDGSLISSYLCGSDVELKSKGSLTSQQAVAAKQLLIQTQTLHDFVCNMTKMGLTVNMEYCSPDNRIVIGYLEPQLCVLNVRANETGEYIDYDSLKRIMKEYSAEQYLVDQYWIPANELEKWVAGVYESLEDIEGYVVRTKTNTFKIKTNKYSALHHTKDSVNNPRRLFEAVLAESADDLLAMFATDKLATKIITEMQQSVSKIFNHVSAEIDHFWRDHNQKSRKDYAIAAQQKYYDKLPLLPLLMQKYIKGEVDVKEWMKAKYKEFGFRDVVAITE